jgi:hypothetical protein
MKKNKNIDVCSLRRRTFLRGVVGGGAAVAIGMPVLDAMLNDHGTAYADGTGAPIRFGTFYWGGGIVHDAWVPSTTGMGWDLPMSLQPFAPVRDYVTLITGTNHAGSSPGHIPARGLALSASHDMNTSIEGVGTYRGQNHPEPSVDALVAEHWDTSVTPFDRLDVSICQTGPYRNNSSWNRGGTAYNRHEPQPQALFDRVFSSGVPESTEDPRLAEATNLFERSVLDAVTEDANRLSARLGVSDRARLEQHLDGIRAIERRLGDVASGTAMCADPTRPVMTDFGDRTNREQKEAKSQLQSQILASALACDMTRIFSYEWSATQSEAVYWEEGIDQEHHLYNHDNARGDGMARITRFIMQNLSYFAQQLAAMPEAGGTVLDNTLIIGTSEHAVSGAHNYTDHPYILVGGAGGGIRRGMHFRHPSAGSNGDSPRCLLTAVRAVGADIPQLGQESSDGRRVATEPFSEVLV